MEKKMVQRQMGPWKGRNSKLLFPRHLNELGQPPFSGARFWLNSEQRTYKILMTVHCIWD